MSVALNLESMSPTEVQDYLVRLALEAFDRSVPSDDMATRFRATFEAHARERMTQAAGAFVLSLACVAPDDEPADIDTDEDGYALASAGLGTDEDYGGSLADEE